MDDSDEALMAQVARGDERAFQLLSRRHLPAMLGLARRILRNSAEAEDVAQEAFLRVWTHAPRWQPVAQFRTWLTRVVVNLCLDRKRRAPWVELEVAGEIVDPTPGAGEKAETDERARILAAAVDKLPPRQRSAIVLTYGEGMTNAQVAEIIDTSVSAVETLLVRGKQNLRSALGDLIERMSEMTGEQFESFLKTVLTRQTPAPPGGDEAAAERVLKRLSGPLPRQKQPLWRLPSVLLNWEFAPAWPRMAALACCAALGFVVGIAGLDRPFDQLDATYGVSNRDIGSIVSEPDSLTGERP